MHRRLISTSAVALVLAATFLTGSGVGSSAAAVRGAQTKIPAGLAAAIHARFGARAIRSSSAARETIDPELGLAVSLSADGTTALVGAPGVAGDNGAAYIFHASDAGSWSSSGKPVATLTKKHGPDAYFGYAVALSADGTTAFVGAPLLSGVVCVFHVSAEDAWSSSSTPMATLALHNSGLFGWSLALSPDGTTLVAGAPFANDFSGGAYVFHASSEGAWASTSTPTAILSEAGQSADDDFVGGAVAISGDGTTALVSHPHKPNGGAANLYHASAEDAWATSSTPTAILSDSNRGEDDRLGSALALSGDGTVAFLGAYGANARTGAVDVFHSSGAWTSTSTPTAVLTVAGGSPGDEFGADDLRVSSDGTTALLPAIGVSVGRGAAYIFRASSEGAWATSSAPTATLTKAGAHVHDLLGVGAMLSPDGATALVGAPGVRKETGAAYVFHVSDASAWATTSTPNARLTNDALAHCVVPKLKGMTLPAAKFALAAGRCNLGRVTKVHSAHRKGRVLSQSRKRGTRLAIHAKVNVRVGK